MWDYKDKGQKWFLGSDEIEETSEYKYLGDIITSDGKNKENLKARKVKAKATVITVKTIAANEVINNIETAVLLELHEKICIASLLNNAESWSLNKGEEEDIEKTEIQALKDLFDLPLHIPTTAIVHTFGVLFTKQRIDLKVLTFLHKILNKEEGIWLQKTLLTLETLNIGWFKKVQAMLNEYELPDDLTIIKDHTLIQWPMRVKTAIEKKHKERLVESCYKVNNGIRTPKTKTMSIVDQIENETYRRAPVREILYMTKNELKTVMIARFGMLHCGKNHQGTMNQICDTCKCIDDENHRINDCKKWKDRNLSDSITKVDFNDIYSADLDTVRALIPHIESLWNTKNAQGSFRTE